MRTTRRRRLGCDNLLQLTLFPLDMWTNDPSATCDRLTSLDTRSATSLLGLPAGVTPSGSLAGPMTDPSGPAPAHASRSPRRAKGKAPTTSATSGQSSSILSASAALSMSLASRLQTRLATVGSMEYRQTWNRKVTPSGRLFWAHTASAHRTPASDFTGWPTCTVNDATGSAYTYSRGDHSKPVLKLPGAAQLTGWPTPCSQDGPKGGPNQGADRLPGAAALAGWPTPKARDHHTEGRGQFSPSLASVAELVFGVTSESFTASTEKRGALAPEFSRWLMGFPAAWDSCGATAMQSSPRSRRNSSKHSTESN